MSRHSHPHRGHMDEEPDAQAPAHAAATSSSSSAAAASNPLSSLLRDLQCGICLSVASDPTSLPCHHFFCSGCLQRQMDAEASAEKAKRKAKSNETLRKAMTCPMCRKVYTRRTIVEDPLIQRMATLALQLKRCADVQELVEPEEGIFDMSQSSSAAAMQPSPQRITRARSAESVGSMDEAAAAAAAAATPTRRHSSAKHSTPATAAAASSAPATRSTPASASKAAASSHSSHPPPAPYDPFAFHSSETQRSSPPRDAPAAISIPTRAAAAQFSTPTRSGRAPRKNYKEQSQESLDDRASDDASEGDSASDGDNESGSDEDQMDADVSMLHSSAAAASSDVSMLTTTPGSSAKKPRKGYPIKDLPAGTCAVCCQHSEEEETVSCKLCKVSVHRQLCYGPLFAGELDEKARNEWYCDRCSPSMGTKVVSCALCPNLDDQAFKKTDQGTWVHASCALWGQSRMKHVPECRYRNPDQRQLVIVRDVKKDRYTVPCNFCTGKGAIIQCTYPNCSFSYHAPCGMRRGIEFELWRASGASQLMSQEEGADDVFYHNFCAKHAMLKHKVPACNSAVAVSAKKMKQQKKNSKTGAKSARKTTGGAKRRREEKTAQREASASSDESDSDRGGGKDASMSSKRARSSMESTKHSLRSRSQESAGDDDGGADRSAAADTSNAAMMSIGMSDDVTSSMETPGRATPMEQAFSLAAHIKPTEASPFNAHTPAAAGASTRRSSSSTHASPIQPALSISRKLDFPTTPAPAAAAAASSALPNATASVGISTRRSPLKAQLPPMVRSASMGSVSSSAAASSAAAAAASAAAVTPELSRPLRKRGASPAMMDTGAAAASPAAAATSFTTPARIPLRSMDRAEVHARDHPPSSVKLESPLLAAAASSSSAAPAAAASTPASSSRSAGRALAKRHHMVLMGTRLDTEQSALLEELATLLNDLSKESSAKKPLADQRFVSVQSHWDDSVTHVVTAASDANGFILPSRTIKYFQGLLSSAWVVGIDWVAASICARRVVSEAEYLVQGDAKLNGGEITLGAKRARANREALFANQHFVLLQPFKPALRKDVQQLIEMGGGDVREAFPTAAERRGRKTEVAEAHASDIEEADEGSQSSLPSPAKGSSKGGAAAAAAAASSSSAALATAALSGRWYLLSDDTSAQTRAQLSKHVSPALAKTCAQQNIAIVGVSWLFDSISAMKLRPTPV